VLFTSIAFAELAGSFAMRSERVSLWRLGPFTNRTLVGAVALTVVLQILIVVVPVARDIFGLERLAAEHWLLVTAIAIGYLAVVEIDKAIHRRASAHAG
jgi:Ca2+-transporting ATPase